MEQNTNESSMVKGPLFNLIIFYLILDYGRPQDIVHAIGYLKPILLISLVMIVVIFNKYNVFYSKSSQTTLIWLFIILTAIHIPFAVNNSFAFNTTKALFVYMVFITAVILEIDSVAKMRKLIFAGIVIMIYVSFYALTHNGIGSGNYFQDENDVSLYVNMWLPYCYFLFAVEKSTFKRIVFIAGLVFGLLSIVVSFSRGGFVGLVLMGAIAWLFSNRKLVSIAAMSVMAILLIAFGSDAYWKEMSTVTDTQESTARARLYYWEKAWLMFLDNPLGVGGNNYQVRVPEYQDDSEGVRGLWGQQSHSIWFTLLPDLGIPGTLLYLILMYINIRDIFFLKRLKFLIETNEDIKYIYYLSLAFIASLAGFFASASFISVLYYPHYWYITGIIVAAIRIAHSKLNEMQKTDPEPVSA
ncbi:MAG: O-antigen ligase family protein [Calditrichae bacterium]|nr:O-antigen ligase family protein [Calditrichia bacterium]